MIWDNAGADEYPGVRVFTDQIEGALIAAHDSLQWLRLMQNDKPGLNQRAQLSMARPWPWPRLLSSFLKFNSKVQLRCN
jgi:hypothetical protein